ncbi:hypothetical protein Bhyg_04751, partial [Pseudolycoriella hygida]
LINTRLHGVQCTRSSKHCKCYIYFMDYWTICTEPFPNSLLHNVKAIFTTREREALT